MGVGDGVAAGGVSNDATPAHLDGLFAVLLCVGGPAHGQLIERHPSQHSYVDIQSGETYVRRRFISRVATPLGGHVAFMQQVLAWVNLNQAEIQVNIQNLVMAAWFKAGVQVDIAEPEQKSRLIIPKG